MIGHGPDGFYLQCDYCKNRFGYVAEAKHCIEQAKLQAWRIGDSVHGVALGDLPACCPHCQGTWARARWIDWQPGTN